MAFKIGDRVKCLDFSGSDGQDILNLYGENTPIIIVNVFHSNGIDFICLNGTGGIWSSYANRFVLWGSNLSDDAATAYEETMEYERLINGG